MDVEFCQLISSLNIHIRSAALPGSAALIVNVRVFIFLITLSNPEPADQQTIDVWLLKSNGLMILNAMIHQGK